MLRPGGYLQQHDHHEYLLGDEEKAEAREKDKAFIEDMEESLAEYLRTEGEQLARVLTMQASKYMVAAWRVTGREKLPPDRAASRAKVDLEALERWIRFLGKEPRHYPYLEDWQAMMPAAPPRRTRRRSWPTGSSACSSRWWPSRPSSRSATAGSSPRARRSRK